MIAAEVKNIKASWLNEIPSHWEIVRLKTLVKGGTNGVWGSEPKSNKNDIVCVRVADIDEWQYGISESDLTYRNIQDSDQNCRLLNYGDLIIEKSGGGEISPVGRVVIYNLDKKAVTSNFMARLNVVGDINKEFLYYYFRFLYHRRLNHPAIKATTGIQNLDLYAYLQNPIAVPTPKEQESIVEFINQTSGEITRFIQTKQRFIELLKEQRQSIITNAVTKGIDENVKLKKSPIGNIPEHWNVRRLKFCLSEKLKYGANASGDYYDSSWYRYVRITDFNALGNLDENNKLSLPPELGKNYELKEGDILLARSGGTVGKSFQFKAENSTERCCYAGYLIKAAPNEELILSDFLYNFTLSNHYDNWKGSILIKATIENISAEKYANLLVTLPPIQEQKQIVEHIKTETKTLDIAISKAEREIELIKEYREAMISEAVTGKMKL